MLAKSLHGNTRENLPENGRIVGAAHTTTIIGTSDTDLVLEAVEVVDTAQDMVGIGTLPQWIAAASWVWAPGVLLPILAGNTLWGGGDGDIGSGMDNG